MTCKEHCCYLLENTSTMDQYIGVTNNFNRRLKEHSIGSNKYLKIDILKYGWDAFKMQKILIGTEDYCYNIEDALIKLYNCEKYNIASGGKIASKYQVGEYNNAAKLKREDVLTIRKLYKTNVNTQVELGKLYNLSVGHIHRIVSGESWSSIPEMITIKQHISEEDVYNMRVLFLEERVTQAILAEMYFIDVTQVSNILRGNCWGNAGGPLLNTFVDNKPKLNSQLAREIRELVFKGSTQVYLATKFNINKTSISKIVLGRTYKYAGGPIKGVDYGR